MTQTSGTILTSGLSAGGSGGVAPAASGAPPNGADAAIQAVLDGPPEYIPAKYWDADKKTAKLEDLGRGYQSLEKMLGRDRIPVPTGDDDVEGWQRWAVANGRPEKPDEYEFERPVLPEDLPYDEGAEQVLRQLAHSNGMNKKQAKNFYNDLVKFQIERHASYHQHQKQAKAEVSADILREHGAQYERVVADAQTALKHFGDEETFQELNATGLGNHRGLLRMLSRVGREMTGDTQIKGRPAPQAQPADLDRAIAEFRSAHHKVLFDNQHPDHARRTKEYDELFDRRYAE